MKHSIMVLLAFLAFSAPTMANARNDDGGTTCNGNGSCAQTTNNNITNQGGQGGNGYGLGVGVGVGIGQGGNANATGGNAIAHGGQGGKGGEGGKGGSVIGSGNSTVLNSVNNNTSVKNTVTNLNGQDQKQGQGQLQGQKQGQGQSQSANNEGNTQTINIAAPKTYRPPVSTAVAPTVFPTAICMGSASGAVQSTLFGVSVGKSYEATECMIGETARSFYQSGLVEDSDYVRCQSAYAKSAPICKAIAEGKYTTRKAFLDGNYGEVETAQEAKAADSVEAKVSSLPEPELVRAQQLEEEKYVGGWSPESQLY